MKRIAAMALLLAFGGLAAAEPPAEPPLIQDRDPSGQFVIGKATLEEVKAKLGTPLAQNRNNDGSAVLTYLSETGDYVTYVFDKRGVLVRARAVNRTN